MALSLDQTTLEQALRMAAGARLQTAKVDGETASIILEVSGLDRAGREALEAKVREAARAAGEATVPTSIGLEKATNPFMRATSVAELAARRAAKDAA